MKNINLTKDYIQEVEIQPKFSGRRKDNKQFLLVSVFIFVIKTLVTTISGQIKHEIDELIF